METNSTTSTISSVSSTTVSSQSDIVTLVLVIPILMWITAVTVCYPLVFLFYRFCLKVRFDKAIGLNLVCWCCSTPSPDDATNPTPGSESEPSRTERVVASSPPPYAEALDMERPKAGDVIRFMTDASGAGALCSFVYGEDLESCPPPVYDFAASELMLTSRQDDLGDESAESDDSQLLARHQSVTVNLAQDFRESHRVLYTVGYDHQNISHSSACQSSDSSIPTQSAVLTFIDELDVASGGDIIHTVAPEVNFIHTAESEENISYTVASDENILHINTSDENISHIRTSEENITETTAINGNINHTPESDENISHTVATNGNITHIVEIDGNISHNVASDESISYTATSNGNISVEADDIILQMTESDKNVSHGAEPDENISHIAASDDNISHIFASDENISHMVAPYENTSEESLNGLA